MKNIHILPTDKPSRLVKNDKNLLKLCIQTLPLDREINCFPQNIYITSDEEIKEGDWIYGLFNGGVVIRSEFNILKNTQYYKEYGLKIILTTDQDLIAEGVQEIDDEFLEWFVKNPSCEEIKVESINIGDGKLGYIICKPKEELEQDCFSLPDCACKNPDFDVMKGLCKVCGNSIIHLGKRVSTDDNNKQETLEEFIKEELEDVFFTNISERKKAERLIELGVKWQQERSYSEEDVREAFKQGQDNMEYSEMYGFDSKLTEQEWFEQFKKK